jgi:hypothetical protein
LYKVTGAAPNIHANIAYNIAESVNVNDLFFVAKEGEGGRCVGFDVENIVTSNITELVVGCASINSTLIGNTWKRSTQAMFTLDDAGISIEEAMASYATTQDSSLYLNHG